MLKQLFIVICSLSASISWIIEVNQPTVTPKRSKNVTISCHHDNDDINKQTMSYIYRIRITKFEFNNGWVKVASLSVSDPLLTTLTDATVTGLVDNVANSFIEIDFNVATHETIGQFTCEIDAFDENQVLKNVKTNPIIISERGISYDDLQMILLEIKQQEKENNADLKNGIEVLKESIQLMDIKNNEISNVINNITMRLNIIERKQSEESVSIVVTNLTERMGTITKELVDLQTGIYEGKETEHSISITIANLTNRMDIISNDVKEASIDRKHSENTMSVEVTNLTNKVNEINTDIAQSSVECQHTENTMLVGFANFTKEINEMDTRFVDLIGWPGGQYTLLKPDTGCPDSITSSWMFSSLKMPTQAFGSSTGPLSSSVLNISGDVFQHTANQDYVYLEMCSMRFKESLPLWPEGSYCVQVYSWMGYGDVSCPKGFQFGYTQFGSYDPTTNKDVIINLPGYDNNIRKPATMTNIFYCCKNDGTAADPVVLPRKQPFYLYRYGGQCQQVVGMTSSSQWFYVTRDASTGTGFTGNIHPDGFVDDNGIRIELCYYMPNH